MPAALMSTQHLHRGGQMLRQNRGIAASSRDCLALCSSHP